MRGSPAMLLLLALAVMGPASADPFSGKVSVGGAGFTLKTPGGERLVLYGILGPGDDPDLIEKARGFVQEAVIGKAITWADKGRQAGVHYVRVLLPDGADLSEALLAAGLARWDKSLWPDESHLGPFEAQGQAKRSEADQEAQAALEKQREEEQRTKEEADRERRHQERRARADRKYEEERALWERQRKEWTAMTPAQRQGKRAQLIDVGEDLNEKLFILGKFYERIRNASQDVADGAAVLNDVTRSYDSLRTLAPERTSPAAEAKLQSYWNEINSAQRTLQEWRDLYNAMAEEVRAANERYTAEADLIARLDAALPADTQATDRLYVGTPTTRDAPIGSGQQRFGTGFIVAKGGFVLTCAHVVSGVSEITVSRNPKTLYAAKVVLQDANSDWCILQAEDLQGEPIPLATGETKSGSVVYCLGYPLPSVLENPSPVAGSGNVAALQGINGDERHIQVTVPINPGNSGSPVLNKYGEWVGLASHKLNDLDGLRVIGAVPQGINFAVKCSCIEKAIGNRVAFERRPQEKELSLEDVVEKCSASIVRVTTR